MSLKLPHRPLPLPLRPVTTTRTFTTTPSRPTSLQLDKNPPSTLADTVPPYPYGPARWYKQSDRGLYGGARIQFGNNVGPKFNTKTRRTWHPNVFRKRLFSRALGRDVQVKVSTRVMRTIDKVGGLDRYVLGEKEARVRELGVAGWWLRWAVLQTQGVRREVERERERLGLGREEDGGLGKEEGVLEEGAGVEDGEVLGEGMTHRQRRLKFRVGPRAHLYYTPSGWRRALPDAELRFKAGIRKNHPEYREYHDDLTATAFGNFDALVEANGLDVRGQQSLRRKLKDEVEKKAEKLVEALWKQREARKAYLAKWRSLRQAKASKQARLMESKAGQAQRESREREDARRERLARLGTE